MRVVVTGGAGFIGSNVAARYLSAGEDVIVVDNLRRPGSEVNLRWLQELDSGGHLQVVAGDVRDAAVVQQVVGAPGIDRVFHFAAQTAVTTSLVAPRDDLEINLLGTFNVLEAVRQSRASDPPLVFFTSTNKVYGSLAHQPVREDATRFRFADPHLEAHGVSEAEPLDFHSPYGCSKGAADQYVRDYARIYGLRTVVFRMSCIYGARQFGNEDQGWLAHFLIRAASGQPLTIYGTGKQVRDILYVDDLVRAFWLAAENSDRTAGQVYNMGGGPDQALAIWTELRPLLKRVTGCAPTVTYEEARPGDQPVYVSATDAATRDFGWTPRISIDEGLQRLWDWVRPNVALFSRLQEPTSRRNGDQPYPPVPALAR